MQGDRKALHYQFTNKNTFQVPAKVQATEGSAELDRKALHYQFTNKITFQVPAKVQGDRKALQKTFIFPITIKKICTQYFTAADLKNIFYSSSAFSALISSLLTLITESLIIVTSLLSITTGTALSVSGLILSLPVIRLTSST